MTEIKYSKKIQESIDRESKTLLIVSVICGCGIVATGIWFAKLLINVMGV